MRALDRALQRWRIAEAAAFLRPGDAVLDVGSADGALWRQVKVLGRYVGVDPEASPGQLGPGATLRRGVYPAAVESDERFDAVVMLACLEHIPPGEIDALLTAFRQHLREGAFVIVTVPEAAVDRILDVLKACRLVDGMALEEHHGFEASSTQALFEAAGFRLHTHRTFQLGLNNLYVFRKG